MQLLWGHPTKTNQVAGSCLDTCQSWTARGGSRGPPQSSPSRWAALAELRRSEFQHADLVGGSSFRGGFKGKPKGERSVVFCFVSSLCLWCIDQEQQQQSCLKSKRHHQLCGVGVTFRRLEVTFFPNEDPWLPARCVFYCDSIL